MENGIRRTDTPRIRNDQFPLADIPDLIDVVVAQGDYSGPVAGEACEPNPRRAVVERRELRGSAVGKSPHINLTGLTRREKTTRVGSWNEGSVNRVLRPELILSRGGRVIDDDELDSPRLEDDDRTVGLRVTFDEQSGVRVQTALQLWSLLG